MNRPVLTEQFVVRLTAEEGAFLDRMAADGGYPSRNALFRSILRAIIDDEQKLTAPAYDRAECEQVMGAGR